jgi:hypothetical protein
VPFSGKQWLVLVALDGVLRVGYFNLGYFLFVPGFFIDPIAVFVAVLLSAVHLAILRFTIGLTIRPGQATRASIAVAVLITNVIFIGFFISIWVAHFISGEKPHCFGYRPDCAWIEGLFRLQGGWRDAFAAIMQIVINVIPLMVVGAFKRTGNRSAP